MKKYIMALLIVVMLFSCVVPTQEASADAILITQLAAGAYAIAAGSGLTFHVVGGTAAGMQTWMESRLSTWTNNNGGMSIWGSDAIRALAGKIAIAQSAYELLKDFLNDLINDEGIGTTETQISPGLYGGIFLNAPTYTWGKTSSGFSATKLKGDSVENGESANGYYYNWTLEFFYDGVSVGIRTISSGGGLKNPVYWVVTKTGNNYTWTIYYNRKSAVGADPVLQSFTGPTTTQVVDPVDVIGASVSSDGMNYEDVDIGGSWTGDIGEQPDTNLDDLLEEVFGRVADNDLIVEPGTDEPMPTPQPTYPPGTGDITDVINQLLEMGYTMEQIQQMIAAAQSDLASLEQLAATLGTTVGSLSVALSVPEANAFRLPDLRTLFPFSIPFDLYNIISAFSVEPQAPHVQIPFNIPRIGLQYTFDLDFSAFNGVAQVCRTMEFIAFAIGLAILTSKVIRW